MESRCTFGHLTCQQVPVHSEGQSVEMPAVAAVEPEAGGNEMASSNNRASDSSVTSAAPAHHRSGGTVASAAVATAR